MQGSEIFHRQAICLQQAVAEKQQSTTIWWTSVAAKKTAFFHHIGKMHFFFAGALKKPCLLEIFGTIDLPPCSPSRVHAQSKHSQGHGGELLFAAGNCQPPEPWGRGLSITPQRGKRTAQFKACLAGQLQQLSQGPKNLQHMLKDGSHCN